MSKLTLPSGRTVEEALDATYQRTATLRRRRWAVRFLPVVLLAVVAVPAAMAAVSSEKPVGVTAADEPNTTTTTEVAPATTTTAAPTTTTTTSTHTPGAVGGTTTTLSQGPNPTTTSERARACAAAEMSFNARTSSSTYKSGARVPLSATVRNVGQSSCFDTSPTGYAVLNAKGEALNAVGWPDGEAEPSELQPGQSRTEAFEWDGRLCDTDRGCYDAPPGTYTIRVRWGDFGTADTDPITVN